MFGEHRDLHDLTLAFPTRGSAYFRLLRVRLWNRRARAGARCRTRRGVALRADNVVPANAPVVDRDRPRRLVQERAWERREPRLAAASGSGLPPLPQGPEGRLPVSRSGEHTSELQSLMRISYAVF